MVHINAKNEISYTVTYHRKLGIMWDYLSYKIMYHLKWLINCIWSVYKWYINGI